MTLHARAYRSSCAWEISQMLVCNVWVSGLHVFASAKVSDSSTGSLLSVSLLVQLIATCLSVSACASVIYPSVRVAEGTARCVLLSWCYRWKSNTEKTHTCTQLQYSNTDKLILWYLVLLPWCLPLSPLYLLNILFFFLLFLIDWAQLYQQKKSLK